MPREKITLTAEFKTAVSAYQKAHKIQSWSQALLTLAALGYHQETGQIPPAPFAPWGGKRTQLDLERLEVRLMGLPPLADDDE